MSNATGKPDSEADSDKDIPDSTKLAIKEHIELQLEKYGRQAKSLALAFLAIVSGLSVFFGYQSWSDYSEATTNIQSYVTKAKEMRDEAQEMLDKATGKIQEAEKKYEDLKIAITEREKELKEIDESIGTLSPKIQEFQKILGAKDESLAAVLKEAIDKNPQIAKEAADKLEAARQHLVAELKSKLGTIDEFVAFREAHSDVLKKLRITKVHSIKFGKDSLILGKIDEEVIRADIPIESPYLRLSRNGYNEKGPTSILVLLPDNGQQISGVKGHPLNGALKLGHIKDNEFVEHGFTAYCEIFSR